MKEPVWISSDLIIQIHAEQLAIFGGPPGIRDPGLLESALGRPRHRFVYGGCDLAELAAAYAFAIARNHPFVDGNKRAAFAALAVFLGLNDMEFTADPADAAATILSLAAGDIGEDQLSDWVRRHLASK